MKPRFFQFESPRFKGNPRGWSPSLQFTDEYSTCGTSALGILLKDDLSVIESRKPKNQTHWSHTAMERELKKHFAVLALNNQNRDNRDEAKRLRNIGIHWETHPLIKPEHVLVASMEISMTYGTWIVMHKGCYWHNFRRRKIPPLLFINCPIMKVWLVWHPDWSKGVKTK
jgi:hypothetical protein